MLRLNAVWYIMNLSYPDNPGVFSRIERLIDVGILSQLKTITDDRYIDLKDCVKTILEQFMVTKISTLLHIKYFSYKC